VRIAPEAQAVAAVATGEKTTARQNQVGGLGQRDYGAQSKSVLTVEGQHAYKLIGGGGGLPSLSADES